MCNCIYALGLVAGPFVLYGVHKVKFRKVKENKLGYKMFVLLCAWLVAQSRDMPQRVINVRHDFNYYIILPKGANGVK